MQSALIAVYKVARVVLSLAAFGFLAVTLVGGIIELAKMSPTALRMRTVDVDNATKS